MGHEFVWSGGFKFVLLDNLYNLNFIDIDLMGFFYSYSNGGYKYLIFSVCRYVCV